MATELDIGRFPAAAGRGSRRQMGGGVAIVPTAPERVRNRDAHFPYRFDSYFYYLTGFREPEAVLVVVAGASAAQHALLPRAQPRARDLGRLSLRAGGRARSVRLRRGAFRSRRLDELVPGLLADCGSRVLPSRRRRRLGRARDGLGEPGARARRGAASRRRPRSADVHALLDEMRLVKDAERARAHAARGDDRRRRRTGARCARRGRARRVRDRGGAPARVPAPRRAGARPIRRSSPPASTRACCTTWRTTAMLEDGELLLIDAGCELDGYASDVTRTFPVNGRFSAPQRAVYELVLAAQAAAIAEVRPGNAVGCAAHGGGADAGAGHDRSRSCSRAASTRSLERETYRQFYMHRTGPLAGPRRARRRRLQARRRVAQARARHGADGRARLLHPRRRRACRASSRASACASRTTCS